MEATLGSLAALVMFLSASSELNNSLSYFSELIPINENTVASMHFPRPPHAQLPESPFAMID